MWCKYTWIRDFACKITGPSHNLTSSNKTRTVANVIFCDVTVTFVNALRAVKTSPSNASIGAILDTGVNEHFETFSTLLLVST